VTGIGNLTRHQSEITDRVGSSITLAHPADDDSHDDGPLSRLPAVAPPFVVAGAGRQRRRLWVRRPLPRGAPFLAGVGQ
jgi:hypothetical protein